MMIFCTPSVRAMVAVNAAICPSPITSTVDPRLKLSSNIPGARIANSTLRMATAIGSSSDAIELGIPSGTCQINVPGKMYIYSPKPPLIYGAS